MSKPKCPVPLPRRQRSLPDKTEDNKPSKCSLPPLSPTHSPEGGLVCSTPPLVSPKKWTVKKNLEGIDAGNGRLDIVKVTAERPVKNYCARPPPLPAKPPKEKADDEDENEILDAKSLLEWWERRTSWNVLCKDLKLRGERETKIIRGKAQHLYKAIKVYIILLSKHGGTLREHIAELLCIADNLDKVSKGTKIAGITGGASTVLGGVAAAAGVILSPFTLGASLGLTVVGVGVAAAGGVTGASAAIAHKVNITQDKNKIIKILNEYKDHVEVIQECLTFIDDGMRLLKQHDLSIVNETRMESVRVVRELAATGGASAGTVANDKESGLIHVFATCMEMFFTQGKNGQKLKKGLESKFAMKIRTLAEELSNGLAALIEIKNSFSEHCSEE